jgi:23S rRNA pseudouridine1911/1915/1917 synthase
MTNQGYEYEEIVGTGAHGRTALDYLAARYTHSSRSLWADRLGAGQVSLDGAPAAAGDLLREGQRLAWKRPPWEEGAAPLAFALLHRDEHLLAVAKPRGLPTVPGGGFLTHTLLHLVRRHWPEATPAHRLGRGTSGLVLFARTASARGVLAAAWRERRVEKVYRALVEGIPDQTERTIDAPIGPVPHPRLGRVHARSPSGRPALTRVRVIGVRGGNALVEARIDTGRPHQIRIHLAAAGHALVGDPVYAAGGGLKEGAGLPGDPGYWLHAHRLTLEHPASGEIVRLECPPPPLLST